MDCTAYTLLHLRDALQQGDVGVDEVLQAFKQRINKLDPSIESFILLDWDRVATRVQELQSVTDRSKLPLYGVPIGVKDTFVTHGMQTTAGSKILEGYIGSYDATVVQKLYDAGAIIVGKQNCDEFAMGGSTETSAYKQTKNPYDLGAVPGGSSGGSAAGVAARMVMASIGSDTGGSIRQPAAFCGVVGLKPTYGLVSRYGLIAMASSLDTVGPLTQTVADAALMLDVIAGPDPYDSTSYQKNKKSQYIDAVEKPVKGLRVGIPKEINSASLEQSIVAQLEQTKQWLQATGVEVVEVSMPHLADALAVYYVIMPAEVSSNMARYDGMRYGQATKQADSLIAYYMKTRGEFLGAEVKRRIMVGTYVLSSGYADAYYKTAQKVRRLIVEDFQRVYKEVDALLLPTTPTPAFGIGEKVGDPLEMYLADMYTVGANIAGVPALSVPSGMIGKLPFGIQLMGKHHDEATLFALGSVIEKARGTFGPPSLSV